MYCEYLQAAEIILVANIGEFDDLQGSAVALLTPEIIQGLFATY